MGEPTGCCFCGQDIPDPGIPDILEISVTWNDTPGTKWDVPDFLQDEIGSLTWWAHLTCFSKLPAREPKRCCFCTGDIPDPGTPDIVEISVTWIPAEDPVLQDEDGIPPPGTRLGPLWWWAHDKCFREALKPEYRPFNRTY